jgi:hypothetical protein
MHGRIDVVNVRMLHVTRQEERPSDSGPTGVHLDVVAVQQIILLHYTPHEGR